MTKYGLPTDVLSNTSDMILDADPSFVWDVVRDIYAVDTRLIPGFAVKVDKQPNRRIVMFANGISAAEEILEINEAERRLRYSAVEGPAAVHMGVQEVVAHGTGSRLIWTTYYLPADLQELTETSMVRASDLMVRTINSAFATR